MTWNWTHGMLVCVCIQMNILNSCNQISQKYEFQELWNPKHHYITGSILLFFLSERNLILRKYDTSAEIQRTVVKFGLLQIPGVKTPTLWPNGIPGKAQDCVSLIRYHFTIIFNCSSDKKQHQFHVQYMVFLNPQTCQAGLATSINTVFYGPPFENTLVKTAVITMNILRKLKSTVLILLSFQVLFVWFFYQL